MADEFSRTRLLRISLLSLQQYHLQGLLLCQA